MRRYDLDRHSPTPFSQVITVLAHCVWSALSNGRHKYAPFGLRSASASNVHADREVILSDRCGDKASEEHERRDELHYGLEEVKKARASGGGARRTRSA